MTYYIRFEGYCNTSLGVYKVEADSFEEAKEKAIKQYVDNIDFVQIDKEDYEAEVGEDDDDNELPEALAFILDLEEGDDVDEKISDYLSDKFGFCVNSFTITSINRETGEVLVNNIDWDTEE